MSGGGGRTLSDDFDEDDLPGGTLDLETGSHVGTGAAAPATYDNSGSIDFDDELYGDGPSASGSLELDMPGGGPSHRPAPPPPAPAPRSAAGGPVVPDLALGPAPSRAPAPAPPPPASSGSLAPRTSGAHPAAAPHAPQTSQAPQPSPEAPPGAAPGSDPHAAGPASSSGQHAAAPPPAPSRPQPAAIIAKYPAPPEKVLGAPMYAIRILLRQFELRSDLESLRRRRSPDVPLYEAALRTYDAKTFRLGMAINLAALTLATFIFFLPVIIRFMRAD